MISRSFGSWCCPPWASGSRAQLALQRHHKPGMAIAGPGPLSVPSFRRPLRGTSRRKCRIRVGTIAAGDAAQRRRARCLLVSSLGNRRTTIATDLPSPAWLTRLQRPFFAALFSMRPVTLPRGNRADLTRGGRARPGPSAVVETCRSKVGVSSVGYKHPPSPSSGNRGPARGLTATSSKTPGGGSPAGHSVPRRRGCVA